MTLIGKRGIVFAAGSDDAKFFEVGTPAVGDLVTLYNMSDGVRIAVPVLELNADFPIFNTPNFDFAGFNWSIDFNFQLIPLLPLFIPPTQFHNFKVHDLTGGYWIYGDDPAPAPGSPIGCSKKWDGTGYKYPEADCAFLFENLIYGSNPDAFFDVKILSANSIEVWAGAPDIPVGTHTMDLYYGSTHLVRLPAGGSPADYHGVLTII